MPEDVSTASHYYNSPSRNFFSPDGKNRLKGIRDLLDVVQVGRKKIIDKMRCRAGVIILVRTINVAVASASAAAFSIQLGGVIPAQYQQALSIWLVAGAFVMVVINIYMSYARYYGEATYRDMANLRDKMDEFIESGANWTREEGVTKDVYVLVDGKFSLIKSKATEYGVILNRSNSKHYLNDPETKITQ